MSTTPVIDDKLLGKAQEYAATFAIGPTRGFAAVKRIYNSLPGSLREQLEIETTTRSELANSDGSAEGAAAFIQERAANFKGH